MCFLFQSADFFFYLIFINFLARAESWPTSYLIRGHSLAFEACFKLPATCTWTQAAKASLGRQRHTYDLQQELLTWGKWKLQCFTPGRTKHGTSAGWFIWIDELHNALPE